MLFSRKCYDTVLLLVPHLMAAAAILNFRKMLISAVVTLICPMSICIPNFRPVFFNLFIGTEPFGAFRLLAVPI